MNSQLTDDFLDCFARLPQEVKDRARKAYRLWLNNPAHPSLQFKPIRGHAGLWSIRVSQSWRVLGRAEGDTMTWFWIGSHAEYESIIG